MSTDPSKYRPCSNKKCGRPMRPRRMTKNQAPGTVATGHGGQCKSCSQPNTIAFRGPRVAAKKTPELIVIQHEHTLRTLGDFLSRRYARGIAPEPVNPVIALRVVGQEAATNEAACKEAVTQAATTEDKVGGLKEAA